jgi:hypothetical protein
MRTIRRCQGEKNKYGEPINNRVSIGELRAQDRQGLKDVTYKQGFTNVLSKAPIIDGPDMP